MFRFPHFILAAAIAAALLPASAGALELGEISSRAALGQALDAEIALRGVADLGNEDLKISLASQQEFDRLGIERNYFLAGLHFTPQIGRDGRGVIRVQSSAPIREPFVNFVVQVIWPQGRALREYTLLLDPPGYAATPTAPVAMAAPIRPAATAPASAPAADAGPAGSHRVVAGDSLWGIAAHNRPDAGVSVMQTMRAIQALNPQAFIDGNANRPKVGSVLRLPDAQQVRAHEHGAAVAHMQAQNAQWRGQRRTLDATRKTAPGAAPAEVAQRDSLRLVSGKASSKAQEKADSERLAVLQENLDSSRREGEELKSRIADLQSQLDKLNKLVELKDAQLASLVARLAAQARQPAAQAPAAAGAAPVALAQGNPPANPAPQPAEHAQ